MDDKVISRTADAGVKPATSAAKSGVWLKFKLWQQHQRLPLPVTMVSIVNFLGQLKTRAGDHISYGSLRMHKATVVNTLRLTQEIADDGSAGDALLKTLLDTVKRAQPDQAKYSETFGLDDVITWLLEEYEKLSNGDLIKNTSSRTTGRLLASSRSSI